MEREEASPMIIDKDDDAAMVSRGHPDDRALAEEFQLQEVLLFSAFQEMAIEDASVDSLLNDLFRQDHAESSKEPSISADPWQSSSSIPSPGDEFYCPICMESVPSGSNFRVSPCGHAFCLSCVGQYIAAKIGDNAVHVRCPEPRCGDGAVEPEDCRGIIPPELFSKWGLALCESALGKQRIYCPFSDCSVGLLAGDDDGGGGGDGDGEGAVAEAECPHCHRLFCARCMVPWHAGVGCEEFQELGEDERSREDVMVRRLAGEQRWQRCPQCRMYVEKSEGCMFMKCRCGYCFCYSCASPMSKELHYCRICKR